ncbi:hypothetical protein HO133_006297 [Letharia lupina]|uniref:Uncharacterized protein n=1 Tax=Letharia lupina TaxID=560253 RepID=A0A8H6C6Q2_9LECA|nr:uncharacterized protein HO133_006297 [Letharia lupina]KAF6217885.1 hypothetical protein HO133_006297 [Letharia lupina]
MGRKRSRKKPRRKNKVYDTPKKAKVQGAGIPEDPRNVFEFFDVEQRPGYKMIESDAPSRTFHNQGHNETRGRKHKMTGAQVAQVSQLLEDTDLGMKAKGMNWYAIIWELDLDIKSPKTVRDTMCDAFDYGKYKTTLKQFMDQRT